jgi:hypothetical protein
MSDTLKAREEARRDRLWDPRRRWQALQDTISWAEAQAPVRRNTPAACVRIEQRRRETLSATWSEQP